MTNTNKTVFISYAHQPGTLREEVAALAAWLSTHDVAVIFDGNHPHRPPPDGWPRWMEQGIETADVVLLVCTERYKTLFAGQKPVDGASGRGVDREGMIIDNMLYESRSQNHKFFPILPDNGSPEHVPRILQAYENGHRFPSGNDNILKLIMDDAKRADPRRRADIAALGLFHLPDLTLSNAFNDPENHVEALRANLLEQGNTAILAKATVRGMGGVGKTQLALKYSVDYRNDYIGVWWFRAEHLALLEQDCLLFCQRIGIPVTPGMSPQQAFRDGLAQRSGWLLVFDNAEERKMLTAFLPVGGKHHVIVTSRRSGWNMAEIGLNVWSREQALPFLRQRLPAASDDALLLLSDALGGLPLALEQACAYLKHTQATVEDYLAALAVWESGSGLLQRQDSDDYPLSVCQTLALAFDKLSAPARALLALCG